MLDIHELRIFLAAAETGSFSEAGRRLQMSQPAVSMQIRSLEKRLGIELFQRNGRHIRLTEAGDVLIPMAQELVNMAISTEETMISLQGKVVGVLKIACSTASGKYILPKLVAGFIERYAHVRVEVDVCSREFALDHLLDGSAHLAITSLHRPMKDLEYRQFITDPVTLITPPAHFWASRDKISVNELTDGRFIVREVASGTQQAVVMALGEYDFSFKDLDTVMVLANSEAINMAVAEGIGVAFVSRRAAASSINNGSVVEVPVEGLAITQQLHLARHAGRAPTSAQTAFWRYVYAPENRQILHEIWDFEPSCSA